jgi:hypothetical protein
MICGSLFDILRFNSAPRHQIPNGPAFFRMALDRRHTAANNERNWSDQLLFL